MDLRKIDPLKRALTVCISAVVLMIDTLARAAGRCATRTPRGTRVVLYYHGVRDEHRAGFARQMDILARSVSPVRADAHLHPGDAARVAAVTFDDGYENIVDNAIPELVKRNIPATVFIITDSLGQFPCWRREKNDQTGQDRVMSREQLLALPPALITVGSHSMTHPLFSTLSESEARRELSVSRTRLQEILDREITLFSFPYGDMNDALVEWSADSGYQRVFTISPTLAFRSPAEYVTGRVQVEPTDWPLEFYLKLRGTYRWLPFAQSLKRRCLAIGPARWHSGREETPSLSNRQAPAISATRGSGHVSN